MITAGEGTARMADGTLLRTLVWPATGDPWAVTLIVHGLGEHGGRYQSVADALTAAGVEVHAYDQRGFGGSAGPRADIERWSLLEDDLEQRIRAVRTARPDLPLVLYAHSLGAVIAIGYVLDPARPLPDRLVLSSPALEATIPAWKRGLARTIAGVLPRLRISNGAIGDGLSHDPAVARAYVADPLSSFSSTARFASQGFAAQARTRQAVAQRAAMPVPTYVLHGSEDPIVPVAASAAFEGKAGAIRRVHEGLRHECHHEPEQAEVLAEVVAWLRESLVRNDEPVRAAV